MGSVSSASDMQANDLGRFVEGEIGDETIAIAPETAEIVSNDDASDDKTNHEVDAHLLDHGHASSGL